MKYKVIAVLLAMVSAYMPAHVPTSVPTASAQTSPTSAPLVQKADFSYLGSFTIPGFDPAGNEVYYPAPVLGVGADGNSLLVGCRGKIGRISIPNVGGTATFLDNCKGVSNLKDVDPPNGDINGQELGGVLAYGGKTIVSGYVYYDADSSAKASHWTGSSMDSLSGPYRVGNLNPGIVAGQMTTIPTEWRSLLGGPALTGLCCVSIISRSSYGPTASVFDPAALGTATAPSTMLLGYPEGNQNPTIGTYDIIGSLFSKSAVIRGMAFPSGTRSLMFMTRQGTTQCYGTGTNDPSLHNKPIPGGGGHVYCYDPTNQYQGTHGYPYVHRIGAYDANDLLAVKNGTKNAWDVLPYATWDMNHINNNGTATMLAAAFNPATNRWYVREETGGNTPVVHVYQVNAGSGGGGDTTSPTVSMTAPANGSTVTGSSVSVTASASDSGSGMAGVQFRLDGSPLGTEDTSAPYAITWNTTSVTNGSHTLTATARDAAGNTATSSAVAVTVSNGSPTPTADIKANGSDSPAAIANGASATISWSSTNSTSCTVTPGSWTGTSGSQSSGALTASRTYNLACSGAGGNASDSVTVTVAAAQNRAPIGNFDEIRTSDGMVRGWTLDQDALATPIQAHVYIDGPAGTGTLMAGAATSVLRTDVNNTYGATGNHGFEYSIPAQYRNGQAHTVYAYGVDSSNSSVATLLPGSPKTFTLGSSGGTTNVSTVAQLMSAVSNLTSGSTINIAAGTYNLTQPLYLPQGISNVTIKGASRDGTVIQGNGMSGSVNFGFWMDNVNGVTISDLTIRNLSEHGVIANSLTNAPVYRNLRITDIGDQFLKHNPTAGGNGVDNGVLENSILEYSSNAPDTYTNGLDVHFGKNWVVRGNTFRNFRSNSGLVGPAVLMWNGSADTIVERNTFINNHRDISFGLDQTKTAQPPVSNAGLTDHARGVIANNFIYRSSGGSNYDVPIAVFDSPGTKVYYNTVLMSGTYGNAVEYRFSRTTGVDIKNNLTDGSIIARDNAAGTASNNKTNATASMFTNPSSGDLHLASGVSGVVNSGVTVSVTNDFDNASRPVGSAPDLGADEYNGSVDNTDTTAPTVAMTAPADNSTVSGASVTVSANASDNVGVAGVQFKLNGVNLGAEDTTAPYATTWNTTSASNSLHTLTATARDAAGNTSSASFTVRVDNSVANRSPIGNFDEIRMSDGVFRGWALDLDDKAFPVVVHYYVDGPYNQGGTIMGGAATNVLRTDVNTAHGATGNHGFEVAIPAKYRDGKQHSLYLYALDSLNVATPTLLPGSGKTFTLSVADTVLPTVAMTAPADNSTVSGTAVNVAANASDNVGVAGVQFKLNGVNLGTEDTTAPYSTTWNTTSASNSLHTVTAVARDAAGNTAASAITVRVNNEAVQSPPSAPSNLEAFTESSSRVDITWKDNSNNETGFRIDRKTGSGIFVEIGTVSANVTSYSNTGLSSGTTYTYRVRAYNAGGNSGYSNEDTATTEGGGVTPPPPPAPTPVPPPPPTVPRDGKLIRQNGSVAIYVMEYGKKRVFSSWQVFMGFGYNYRNVSSVSNIEAIPSGEALTTSQQRHVRGSVVKGPDKTLYFLGATQRYAFTSWEIFTAWGLTSADILPANSYDLALPVGVNVAPPTPGQVMGESIESGSMPVHTVVKGDGPQVYVVSGHRRLYPLASMEEMATLGYRIQDMVTVTDGDLLGYVVER